MFKLKDRHGRDMCLGMTHEEVIAWIAAKEIRSYRELPQIWYQIQTKERDEARPRSGVLRTREFVMKDSYTLDPDLEALERSYAAHEAAYRRIFTRCGLRFHVVQSDTGMMGGLGSHEFMAPSAAGEDEVALCAACGYAANVELAQGVPPPPPPGAPAPGRGGHARGADHRRGVRPARGRAVADHQDARLRGRPGPRPGPGPRRPRDPRAQARPGPQARGAAGPARRGRRRGSERRSGSIGPVGARGVARILADPSLAEGAFVVGANREGAHLTGVRAGRDFECEFVDLQVTLAGEGCPQCGRPLAIERVIEVGNIFKLGTRYAEALGAMYLDGEGRERPIVMGSYGIGPARIAAAAVEQRHDADGLVWPWAIAPFQVHVVPVAVRDAGQMQAAEGLAAELEAAGFEVLIDDRDERAGVKFKDADLLGVPIRVTVGNAFTKEGLVEVRDRAARTDRRVARAEAVTAVSDLARQRAAEAPPKA